MEFARTTRFSSVCPYTTYIQLCPLLHCAQNEFCSRVPELHQKNVLPHLLFFGKTDSVDGLQYFLLRRISLSPLEFFSSHVQKIDWSSSTPQYSTRKGTQRRNETITVTTNDNRIQDWTETALKKLTYGRYCL
jgi:hypothetical protein